MKTSRLLLPILILSFAPFARAQEATPSPAATAAPAASATPTATATAAPTPAPTPALQMSGTIEAGATATSGNTNVETYAGALKSDAKWRGWALAIRGAGVYAETKNIQTAGAWEGSIRGDRKLYELLGSYLRFSIDGDRFKGINNRKGAGAGLTLAKSWRTAGEKFDHDVLKGELGYQFYREDDALTTTDVDIQAGRAFLGYLHAFTKETVFSEEAEALDDFKTTDRYLITSVTALAVKLRANLAAKASLTVKDDTKPKLIDPADPSKGRFERVDTLTTFAVILSF